MQRAAARQLPHALICPRRRHQAVFMNAPFLVEASADEILPPYLFHLYPHHQSLHKLAIASTTPSPLTALRSCIHLSVLVRCLSNFGSPLPSLIVQDSDGLPSATKQIIADENSAHANKGGFDCILKEAVDFNANQPSSNCRVVSVDDPAWKQEEKRYDSSSIAEAKAGSPLLRLADTKSLVDTKHVVSPRLLTDPHCTQLAKYSKGNELATSPSDVALQLHGDEGIGVRNRVALEGLLPLHGARCDFNEAGSPSDIIPQAITDGGVKGIDDPVIGSQSSLGDDIRTDSSEACARQSSEQKFGSLREPSVDASLVSFILDEHGWGSHTEGLLQRFIGSITPELVANVVDELKDAKVAFHFIEWAGKQVNFQHREETFTKVVGRLGKNSEFDAVWTVLEFMRKHGLKVDYAFAVFIHRLRSANLVDEAVKAMDRMVSLDVIPTLSLYTVALQLLLSANKLKNAQRLYVQMRQVGLHPDTKLFGILISGFGKMGKVDDALFFFEEMQSNGVPPDSFIYTSLVGAFAAAGQHGEGQKFYTEMVQNNCLPSVLSRLDLECALYGVSSMEKIERFLEDLEIRGHVMSVHTYNNMLQHLLDNKLLPEAVEVFCRLLEEPQKCERFQSAVKRAARPNVESYSLLICGLCKGGKLTEALWLFKEMLVNGFKSSSEVCNCLLHGLSSNEGFIYEAVELSSHIVRAKRIVDVKTQQAFFRSLHTGGDMSKALQIFDTMKWRGCIDREANFHALIDVDREGIIVG